MASVDSADTMTMLLPLHMLLWTDKPHLPMQLMPETLFLTMNVIDRFLEQKPMTRKNLQLVCTSAFSHCNLTCASLPLRDLSTTYVVNQPSRCNLLLLQIQLRLTVSNYVSNYACGKCTSLELR